MPNSVHTYILNRLLQTFLYESKLIGFHRFKGFQELLSNVNCVNYFIWNTKISTQLHWFVCAKLNILKFGKWLRISFLPIVGTLTGITTLGQSGPGNNGNEETPHVHWGPRIGAHQWMAYPRETLVEGLTPLQRCSRHILQCQLTGLRYFYGREQRFLVLSFFFLIVKGVGIK